MPIFPQSQGATLNGGNYIDVNGSSNVAINVVPDNRKGEGIKLLLDFSVQHEAIHDSDARGALGCHPGTREEYIRNVTSWGGGEWQSEKRAFLMTGPAGAGKSAIARTCARKIEDAGNLGASFFFYRPSGWNDPRKFIPTIVYQLTTRYPAYHDCIDAVILGDRLVLKKGIDIQFRELLVKPLQKLSTEGRDVGRDVVIIVDGLDECATVDAQLQIIYLITTSIREKTTPFLWAFFSRPEPPITSAFSSEIATNISWKLPLTLSADADSDIEAYLRGSFQVIRAKHNIPINVTWPKEENIRHLVSQSAGLFVYPVIAIRYIGGLGKGRSGLGKGRSGLGKGRSGLGKGRSGLGKGRSGLEERLCAVLKLDAKSMENPFSALDQLYTLIMKQIPEGVLPNTMSLLYLGRLFSRYVAACCFVLGLSPAEFHVAISNLYSVLEVVWSATGNLRKFHFYHTSFMDFLLDSERSKQYCIRSPGVRQHSLEKVVSTLGTVVDVDPVGLNDAIHFTVRVFFSLVQEQDGKLEENILRQISQVDWNFWCEAQPLSIYFRSDFMKKIPKDWRNRIIRPYYKGTLDFLLQKLARLKRGSSEVDAYVLGQGDKKCLLVKYWQGRYEMRPFPGHATLGFENDSESSVYQ